MPWNKPQIWRLAAMLLLSSPKLLLYSQSPAPSALTPGPAPPQSAPQRPAPLILIDPAHGGADSGAALNAAFPEKDVTLVFARRLRQDLGTRGVSVQLLRDGDSTLPVDQRAAIVNAARPALYVVIHATSQGSGIRLYSAMLPFGQGSRGPFLDWQSAQAPALARSRSIQAQITTMLLKTGPPIRSLIAPLRPLNNITVPAMAIEVAPVADDVSQLASSDYQQTVCADLANGIASAMPLLRTAP
jgi:N-acetylmuramoyl-L-alanine amidase